MTRRAQRDGLLYGLLATLVVVGVLLLLTMWVYPLLLPVCEPAFPEFQLPTIGLDA